MWLILHALFIVYMLCRSTILYEGNLPKLGFIFDESSACGTISQVSLDLFVVKNYNVIGPNAYLSSGRIRFFYIRLLGSDLTKRGLLSNLKILIKAVGPEGALLFISAVVFFLLFKMDAVVSRTMDRFSSECFCSIVQAEYYIIEAHKKDYPEKEKIIKVLKEEHTNLCSLRSKVDSLKLKPLYRLFASYAPLRSSLLDSKTASLQVISDLSNVIDFEEDKKKFLNSWISFLISKLSTQS